MSGDAVALPEVRAAGRPGAARVILALTGSELRSFVRSPVAAFFTIGLPVLFLIIIASLFGNEIIEPRQGVRTAQFFTPALAVFGAAQAAFCTLAGTTALRREQGVYKRLRGTPAPPWTVVAGAISGAVVIAVAAVVVVVAVGVIAFDVGLVGRTLSAALVTLVIGVATFAALGLAVVAVVPTSSAVRSLTNGLLISLAFISDVFAVSGNMPEWLERVGWVFPLKHFSNAFSDAFNPYLPGDGYSADHLAVLAAWAIAGTVIAVRWFSWEPHSTRARRGDAVAGRPSRAALHPEAPGRPSPWRSLRTQIGYALLGLRRDSSSVFFAIIFPVLLLALFPVLMGDGSDRVEAAARMLPAMMAYGLAITAYAILPAPIAEAREQRALARLACTPMPRWAYLAGRVAAASVATTATAVALIAVAVLGFGVRLDAARLAAAAVAFLLGVGCFAALGLALLAVIRRSQTIIAVTLGTLLPLSFISDVFVIGVQMPRPLDLVAEALPLRHTVHALNAALEPGLAGTGFAWADLAVVAGWTIAGLVVARRFSWD